MITEFKKYIEENSLLRSGDRVLAAVSGGIDSMVLADLLHNSGINFGIAHCNFCLRGSESDDDEKLVRDYAEENKRAFYSIRFNTMEYAGANGISIEMAARKLRYEWFEKIRSENDFDHVAVAHNLNDNIETMLLNLTRGTGITGLTGIRPKSGRIIRPLLFATRKSIEEYCRKSGTEYREDRSNSDTHIKRNKIRHEVIPILREINPSVEFTLNDTTERLLDVNRIFISFTDSIRKGLFIDTGDMLTVRTAKLKPHLDNRAVLYELFRPFGITGSLLTSLIRIIRGRTGGQIFTSSHRIIRDRKELVITEYLTLPDEFRIIDTFYDLERSHFFTSAKIVDMHPGFVILPDRSMAFLDNDKILFPLIIRKWKPGDYFYPLGMETRKKLSDYFIDRKYSRLKKEQTYILESGGKIVWILGERIDNRFRITKATSKALILKT